ncbi:uncharacterized protein DUF222 [Motilibacter rhizosphaerae]|uniref:Uncharacterized protein DUF222 n=1 Tax=Motilibacter rhizosphaerae TaxID=598652 RepID=A0A4Q7NAZ3_9ACTN|nr:DUF222 domain-containing protein [Motilibacter rhizosphaerae]RZS79980.1 uncharacterized protein DUF222 [Motilibacter rhizosphaerae]
MRSSDQVRQPSAHLPFEDALTGIEAGVLPGVLAELVRDPALLAAWVHPFSDPGDPDPGLGRREREASARVALARSFDRVVAWASAHRAVALAEAEALLGERARELGHAKHGVEPSVHAQLGLELRLPSAVAALQAGEAAALVGRHPGTWWLLAEGEISPRHAAAVVEACEPLDLAGCAAVEARVLRRAPEQTVAQLRRRLRTAVAVADPRGASERHADAVRRDRGVFMRPLPDAMAEVVAVVSATEAFGVMGALDAVVDALPEAGAAGSGPGAGAGPAGRRSLSQRRADALVLVASAVVGDLEALPGLVRTVPARPAVSVVVSLATVAGLAEDPAHLEGYGPVPAELGRAVAADAEWALRVTGPEGELLATAPLRHQPSARLRAFVVAREQTCGHPTCDRAARELQLDHREAFDHEHPARGGPTTGANLDPKCQRDHNLKTWHGWGAWRDRDGTLVTRTPFGRHYLTEREPQPCT